MSSSQTLTTLIFIFYLLAISYAAKDSFKLPKHTSILFPIRKNQTSLQYYTTFEAGNPQSRTKIDALIDLGAQSVWFDCTSYVSSSYKRAACGSNRCKKALGSVCVGCNSTPRPGCSNNTCGVYAYNPLREYLTAQELGEDNVKIASTDGHSILLNYDVPKFQFSCADLGIVEGLPGDNTRGGGPYYMPPSSTEDQSLSFVTTPLVINPVSTAPVYSEGDASDEYFINVKDIEIDGERVAFDSKLLSFDKNGVGGTKISTTVPYTALHSIIYKRLVKDFVKAAKVDNIKRVKSVAPFGACFDSKTAPMTLTGPAVPDIDLVLEGKTVRFRLYGSNSMVQVKKNVMCLAFVDGGAEPRTSIVLGGHQLENRLLEFDLAASKLGFSSSLLVWNTSCSHYRPSSLNP
ncbi:hypothetical protein E3N88_36059 [Mikania micrantha]|uniref:Peptidase A1 domain-containing protein n=1 Tax=Mikania micrantha TaxID=192012 RepID=A0A5N6M2P6_9ASTR|nr:hypothetical protein E3N88_36059 [Mikania micrantha]